MLERELTSRPIPGITWKQVVAYSVALITFVGMYLDLRNTVNGAYQQSVDNNELFKEIQTEIKEDKRLDDARIQAIELQIRECKVRLDIMEGFIEGYNIQK